MWRGLFGIIWACVVMVNYLHKHVWSTDTPRGRCVRVRHVRNMPKVRMGHAMVACPLHSKILIGGPVRSQDTFEK